MRIKMMVALALALVVLSSTTANAGLTGDSNTKEVKAWQKAAEKTQAYKLRKIVPKQQPRSGGRPVPDSGLTDQDVDRKIQAEIDATSPCAYYYQRSLYCTYQLTDQPADPKKKPAPAAPGQRAYIVEVTTEQAAQMAVAQLRLPAVKPGIGPDPSINRWKMAAVGYPLWLWADGPTRLGPVSQSVANLRVSLRAQLTSVTYDMGDGQRVYCTGPGRKWTRAVEPNQPSRCGYRYQAPSLPRGPYTVRATSHWNITWTIGTQTGVITMDQQGSRTLPVGELQILIR